MALSLSAFWDADLATPLATIDDFTSIFQVHPEIRWVFGARVRLLGRTIERRETRHYSGRGFATLASLLLGLPIYDTQCGAKLFRVDEELSRLLADEFRARWIFDVELVARLIKARRKSGRLPADKVIYEFPLQTWTDIKGSKLIWSDYIHAIFDLFHIWIFLRR
jgi:hypothetical protein